MFPFTVFIFTDPLSNTVSTAQLSTPNLVLPEQGRESDDFRPGSEIIGVKMTQAVEEEGMENRAPGSTNNR